MTARARAAAIYCRISNDPTGLKAGVKRQEDDCRALAKRKGWTVGQVFTDDDRSAYSGKPRPQYREMLKEIDAGRIDAVIVYHLDRLHRNPKELEVFFETCDRAGLRNLASVQGDVDLATDDGRLHARILGAVARKSSDDTSRRLKRKFEEEAQNGLPAGGWRPFGYAAEEIPDPKTKKGTRRVLTGRLVPAEAKLIKEAVRRALDGASLRSICTDWDRRGITTARGKEWDPHVLKRVLVSARIAGMREHPRVGVVPAVWKPIISADEHELLRAILSDPARNPQHRPGPPARSLLTGGTAVCGKCGGSLVARTRKQKRGEIRTLVCQAGPARKGCSGIRVVALPVEDLVVESVLEALSGPRLAQTIARAGRNKATIGTARDLSATRDRLAALDKGFTEGRISEARFFRLQGDLERRIEDLEQELRADENPRVDLHLPHSGRELRAYWDRADLATRRAIIQSVVKAVRVVPNKSGQHRFDPDRVVIDWRA